VICNQNGKSNEFGKKANWYQDEMWILWARSVTPEEICIFKTTMLTESHWKVIKRDYLPPSKYDVGDLVRIMIPRTDRSGVDRSTLPCKVMKITENNQYILIQ
jgi:hypothetical protein